MRQHAGPQTTAPQRQYTKQDAKQCNFRARFDALIPMANPEKDRLHE
jgi:hypothetical protein